MEFFTATVSPLCPVTAGRHEAFTELVRPHLGAMTALASSILGSEDLAWDAVQETLCALWRLHTVPPHTRGWLMRAVTHRSIHALRTLGRRRKHEERAAGIRAECTCCDDPSRLVQHQELCLELEKALRALPDEQRQVFLLREVEQLDYDAIARQLRVPVGTIRSRLNRARAALRDLLQQREWN